MIFLFNYFSCEQPIRSEGDKFGGLLIVYNDTASTISLELLEVNLIINPSKDRIAIIKDLRPGNYSLFVKDNTKEMIIKGIHVSSDSITIVPFYLLIRDAGNTLLDPEKNKRLFTKIRMYGTIPFASISGKVFDGITHKPLKESTVMLKDFPWWSTKTDENGNFCINKLMPGFFIVFADHPNYHREYVLKVQLFNDSTSVINFFLPPLLIPEAPIPKIWDGTITEGPCR